MTSIAQAVVLAICLACQAGGVAQAQTYPARPVRVVVPFPPGGAADFIGRVLAQRLSEQMGQAVTVDNRAGASGNIGAEAVARAPGDGYTLLLGALTSHAINHTLERAVLRYDLQRDLRPVMIVATVPYVLVVHPSVPARSIQEFIAYARSHPGQLSYGSSGPGAPQRLASELFKLKTGIDMLHVPYKGSGQVINDLIGGQVLVAFESVPAALPHVRAGKLRPLAVTTVQRIPMLPDVPTVQEAASFPFTVHSTFGILAPTGTPPAILSRLNAELAKAVQFPGVKERLLEQGAFAESGTPEEATRRIGSEIAMWAQVITDARIKTD
jgi:tripartite-type tricarboxylate transporter receptor subunit TctC